MNENDIGQHQTKPIRGRRSMLTLLLVAIWDNRILFYFATFDYDGLGERFGNRVVGMRERPYLDPNNKSKAQALSEEHATA